MFTMILGPMKSGKSGELLSRVSPYEHTNKEVLYVQSEAHVRDEGIRSRLGINATALAINSLHDVDQSFDVIGIDEVHMFNEGDEFAVEAWLRQGKDVIASGLDLDYRSKMLPIIVRLLELKPDKLVYKTSACDVCKELGAQFTQILNYDEPVLSGLPSVVPEDGTYSYEARCRGCYVKE